MSPTATLTTPKAPSTSRLIEHGCTAVALLTPLKLSWTYVVLIPLLALWLYEGIRHRNLMSRLRTRLPDQTCFAPLGFFILVCAVSVAVGLSPSHSLRPFLSFCFFGSTLILFADRARPEPVLSALIVGQSIASLHSVLEGAVGAPLGLSLIGKVTESGQLALTIPLALGLVITKKQAVGATCRIRPSALAALSAVTTVALSILAFRHDLAISLAISLPLIIGALFLIAGAAFTIISRERDNSAWRAYCLLMIVQIPLMIAALLVNLKRGPWLGVLTGAIVFSLCFAPKLIRWIASCAICSVVFVAPVRDRLLDSYDHFVISGGRSTIWRIGAELSAKYPMGIGFHNSGILQQFAPEIPPELKHFHNNILNIIAENGWIAGALFLWFIARILSRCLSKPFEPFAVSVGCAILSWQTAGLVEYNFGDSEVLLVAWMALGVYVGATNLRLSRTSAT